jgi:hypothetical protein
VHFHATYYNTTPAILAAGGVFGFLSPYSKGEEMTKRLGVFGLISILMWGASWPTSSAYSEAACLSDDRNARELCFVSHETGFTLDQVNSFIAESDLRNIDQSTALFALQTFGRRLYEIKLQSREVVEFFASHQALGFYRKLREDVLSENRQAALERAKSALGLLSNPQDRALLAQFLFGTPLMGRLSPN